MNESFDFYFDASYYMNNTDSNSNTNKEDKKVVSKDMEDLITFRRYLDELINSRENAVKELASKMTR